MAAATTIVNAKVFDGTESRDWTSIRFADGLITECSAVSAAREGDEVIDVGGGTVLPGLIDAHVHLAPGTLAQSLIFGVTTVLDMFSKPDLVATAREQAGSRPGVADVRSSGVGATAPGGHPSLMYAPFPTLTGADQACYGRIDLVGGKIPEIAARCRVDGDGFRGSGAGEEQ